MNFFFIQYLLIFALGLSFGSFANVLIHRLVKNQSLWPRSACPACQSPIAWYDNIPILSFLFLKGRARCCQAKISIGYPLIELTLGFFSVLTFVRENHILGHYFIYFIGFVFPLIIIFIIDAKHMIIPHKLTLPFLPIGLLANSFLASKNLNLEPFDGFLFGLSGLLLGGGVFLILSMIYFWLRKKPGLGGGDIFLAAMLGSFLGPVAISFIFLFSSLFALGFVVLRTLIKRQKINDYIAYGPFLVTAGLFYYFFNDLLFYFVKI